MGNYQGNYEHAIYKSVTKAATNNQYETGL